MTNHDFAQPINVDPAIDALLANAEPVSIIDGLFALTNSETGATSDRWARAVYSRLEARLAQRIRSAVGSKAG